MTTQKFFTSRVHTSSTVFVGDKGRMFYDEVTGFLRLSDGRTPGGSLIYFPISVATSNTIGGVRPDGTTIVINTTTGVITAPYTYTLPTATSSTIGGVRLGPGVTTNGSNQIIIDSTGLDFSFGDIASTTGVYSDESNYAVLSSINLNEDLVLASNGIGGIHIVGEFRINKTNTSTTHALEATPVFEVKADGQVKMLVPVIDSATGAVAIVGSTTGEFISPVNTGVMLHVTGNYSVPAVPSRIYNDSQNTFAAFVARRFNGTVASPTAVLADEEIMRISGTSHNGTTIPGTGQARIVYKALGNQTLTNQGGYIELWATPLNSTTIAKIATINNTDGITATKFTGPLTGDVTGTATTATYAQSFNTGTLVSNAVNAQVATTTTNFNTGTLVANAVNARVATTTTNFNTGTLVANAVNATTATNLTAATSLSAGKLSAATGSVPKNSLATVTYTITGLTTAHKIIISPGTTMPDRQFNVVAAWVSAADTLSIQYANNTGGAISVTLDIYYFAFI